MPVNLSKSPEVDVFRPPAAEAMQVSFEVESAANRLEQAQDVLSFVADGRTAEETDNEVADLVRQSEAGYISGSITEPDAEAGILIGLFEAQQGGVHTLHEVVSAPDDLIDKPLEDIEQAYPGTGEQLLSAYELTGDVEVLDEHLDKVTMQERTSQLSESLKSLEDGQVNYETFKSLEAKVTAFIECFQELAEQDNADLDDVDKALTAVVFFEERVKSIDFGDEGSVDMLKIIHRFNLTDRLFKDLTYDNGDFGHDQPRSAIISMLKRGSEYYAANQRPDIAIELTSNIENTQRAARCTFEVGRAQYGNNILKWQENEHVDETFRDRMNQEDFYKEAVDVSYRHPVEGGAWDFGGDSLRKAEMEQAVLSEKLGLSEQLVGEYSFLLTNDERNLSMKDILDKNSETLQRLYDNLGIVNITRYNDEQLQLLDDVIQGKKEVLDSLKSKKCRLMILDAEGGETGEAFAGLPQSFDKSSGDGTDEITLFAEARNERELVKTLQYLGKDKKIKISTLILAAHGSPSGFEMGRHHRRVGIEGLETAGFKQAVEDVMGDEDDKKDIILLSCSTGKQQSNGDAAYAEQIAELTGVDTWGPEEDSFLLPTHEGNISYGSTPDGKKIYAQRYAKGKDGAVVRTEHPVVELRGIKNRII